MQLAPMIDIVFLLLIFFLLAAGPPTAHAMASAAYRIGLPRIKAVRDDLADRNQSSIDSEFH